MNAARREHVRLSLLRYCEAAGRYGLTTAVLLQSLRAEGLRELQRTELEDEIQYVAEAGLVEKVPKALSPEIEVWKITKAGRDFLAGQGEDSDG